MRVIACCLNYDEFNGTQSIYESQYMSCLKVPNWIAYNYKIYL